MTYNEKNPDILKAKQLLIENWYKIIKKRDEMYWLKHYYDQQPYPKIWFWTFKSRLRQKGILEDWRNHDIRFAIDPKLWIKRIKVRKQSKTINRVISFGQESDD